MKEKNNFRSIVRILGIIICTITLIYSIIYLVQYRSSKVTENNLMHQIQQQKQLDEKNEAPVDKIAENYAEEENANTEKQILPAYINLYKENSDLYGWIKIENTEIDYPVMYTPEDHNFYIDKNWNKEVCYRNVGNSIFIDGRTTENTENIIVYGHNMKNHTMFGSLKNYKEKSYYEGHKYIEFDTLYEKQMYEIISVSKAKIYYDEAEKPLNEYLFYEHIELDTKEEFDEYISNIKANSCYDIGATAEYGDKLITLCTCDKEEDKDGRLIIVAKRI